MAAKALDGLKALAAKPMGEMASPPMGGGDDEEAEGETPLTGAATDLISAIEANDVAGVAAALRSAHEACATESGESGSGEY
jgi:hypothetical protein